MRFRVPFAALSIVVAALLLLPGYSCADSPGFDCAAARGEIETLICSDSRLAQLDRRMTTVYKQAMQRLPADEVRAQQATQRGWIKGRNDCRKAADPEFCVAASYRTRLVELQIISGQLVAPTAVGLKCSGENGVLFAAFYNDSDPPAVVLSRGGDQVIVFRERSASGTKYAAAKVEYWEHQGKVTLKWFGETLACVPNSR